MKVLGSTLSQMEPATVSVIVPCFNEAPLLGDSVNSALGQEGVEIDITVIDDASTDESARIAEEFATSDQRVRLLRHDRGAGRAATVNDGLAAASSEFVTRLDPGDILAPQAMSRTTALLRSFPSVSFGFGNVESRSGLPSGSRQKATADGWTIWAGHEWITDALGNGKGIRRLPGVVMRRSAIDETGGFRSGIEWADAFNLLLRLAAVGSVGRVDGYVSAYYGIRTPKIAGDGLGTEPTDLLVLAEACDMFIDDWRDTLEDPEGMRRRARISMARQARTIAAGVREKSARPEEAAELERVADQLWDVPSGPLERAVTSATLAGRAMRRASDRLRNMRDSGLTKVPGVFDTV